MSRPYLLFAIVILNSTFLFGQADEKAPTQELLKVPIAPTPNAAALGKFGDIPVGISTGIPNISIPFFNYQDKMKNLQLPIGLNYHAGGHKVEDMASNCGLGWSLNAGGMVTRTVNGLPDEKMWGYLNTDTLPNFNTQPGAYFHYVSPFSSIGIQIAITKDEDIYGWQRVKDIQERFKDGEADIFSFNAAGLSGKFIIRKNMEIQLFTQANVSVTVDFTQNNSNANNITGFTVLDKNTGISYIFNVAEVSNPNSISIQTLYTIEPYSAIPSYISNWHLSKIISADKQDTIKFHYETIGQLSYESGFSESRSCEVSGPLSSAELSFGKSSFSHTLMFNDAVHLSSIDLPDSTKIKFYYNFPRLDYVGDSALTSIEIKNGNFTKTYNLAYDYFVSPSCTLPEATCAVYGSANDYYKRLKLLSVQQSAGLDTLPAYRFEYNSTPLPTRKSMSQDFWGYYRGGVSVSLIPTYSFPEFPRTYHLLGEANREANEQYTKAWILEKMTYPTGGHTKFYYEINKAFSDHYKIDNSLDTLSISQAHYNTFTTLPFTNRNNDTVKLRIHLYADTSSEGGPEVPQGCNFDFIIKSTDNSFTDTVTATIEEFLNGYITNVNLPQNKTYQIKYTNDCVSMPSTYEFDVIYDYQITPLDKPIGGLRVAKTEDYDGVTQTLNISNYTYIGTGGHSSGEFQNLPNYHYYWSSVNQWHQNGPVPRWFVNRSSTPNQTLSFYRGSPVIYKRVKVDKTNNSISNGYSIHEFSSFTNTQIISDDYPFVHQQNFEWKHGLLLKDSIFTASSQLVKTVENEYDYFDTSATNGYGRSLLTSLVQNDNEDTEVNLVYGAKGYYYTSGRAELKATKTKSYVGSNALESTVLYFYYPNNYLRSKARTLNSTGDSLETRLYYPANYNSTGIAVNVLGNNGEAELVSKEEWIKKGANWYFKNAIVNDYLSFNSIVRKKKIISTELPDILSESTVGVFNPSQLKRHSSFKDQVEILKYDIKGRFSEISMKGQRATSFIWGSEKHFPIAKTENASESDVAYSSFEESTTGNWTGINSVNVQTTSGITGSKHYNQTSFSISKSGLNTSTVYTVSYWSKNSSAYSISGTQTGWPKTLNTITKGSDVWKLYEHNVAGQSTITITGSGAIDELRLHPKSSVMTTYTFAPLRGITSSSDASNRISFYEYDSYGRLKLIRDQNQNILKVYDYKYVSN